VYLFKNKLSEKPAAAAATKDVKTSTTVAVNTGQQAKTQEINQLN
jgi:hypothetical protein